MSDPYIEMYDGSHYRFQDGHEWNIDTIAHSLGNQCRYTGQCRHFYSVAEHSVLCSLLAEEMGRGDPFEALMHDAHESVISDMASPWKPRIKGWRPEEGRCAADLRRFYGLPVDESSDCKYLDKLALFIEAYYLIPSKGEGWHDPENIRPDALRLIKRDHWKIAGLDPLQAKNGFLARFNALSGQDKGWWKALDADDAAQERFLKLS